MEIPKAKRHVDQFLLDSYRKKPCIICNSRPCDPCHIGTRGAGNPDVDWNLFPACRQHHIEQGQIGFFKFCEKYPFFRQVLAQKGWIFDGNKKLKQIENSPAKLKFFGKL